MQFFVSKQNRKYPIQCQPYYNWYRLVFSRFFDIRRSLENAKEKRTRKTCFSREMKCMALRIYLAKFC